MIGKTISHYKVLEKLGEGGMGVVYKAQDTKLGRFVALKFLPHEISLNEEDKARFLQEAKAASAVSHANVCVIYDIAEADGQQFIVMEYVDGKTLRQMEPIEKVQDALGYAIQIGEALEEAHAKGVVHRDIKAENVMVNTKNQVKVMDFGLAKLRGSLKLTKATSTVGTLAYMAPEQIQGGEVDARSDIFSFGVVFYEMLTGRLPFVGEHEAAMMYSIVNDDPQPIQKYRSDLSPEIQHILSRALEKDPGDRYQTVRDMVIDLRRAKKETTRVSRRPFADVSAVPVEARTHEEVQASPESGMGSSQRVVKRVSNRVLVLGLLVVVIGAVGAMSLLVIRRPQTRPTPATHKQVTFSGNVGLIDISPDGGFAAYVSRVSPDETKMYVQDLAGGQPIEVFKAKAFEDLRWSPDGSEILFCAKGGPSFSGDSPGAGLIVPRLGGTPRKVWDVGYSFAAWSPDGSRLAINWLLWQKWIYLMDTTTGDTTSKIPLQGTFLWKHEVDWSPRGDRLLFCTVAQSRYTISTVRVDGSHQYDAVQDSVAISSPRFSSKGDAVYYLRSQGQTRDLMKVKIDPVSGKPKSHPSIVQTGLQAGNVFSICRDNRRLLYTREQGLLNLWLASYEGGQLKTKQLTTGSSWALSQRISPDGGRIAFTFGNVSQSNVFVMPIEGGRAQQLTFFNSRNDGPVWSPDGKEIAFGSTQGGVPRVWRVRSDGGSPHPFERSELSTDAFNLSWAPCSHILYERLENRNFHVLDPDTQKERPLVENYSVGWMFDALPSPDCRTVAVRWNRKIPPKPGVWLVSLTDSSQTFLAPSSMQPIEWTRDGEWIYAATRLVGQDAFAPEISMLSARGGRSRKLLTLPFENIADIRVDPGGRKFVCTVRQSQSDAWLMENFDPEVK